MAAKEYEGCQPERLDEVVGATFDACEMMSEIVEQRQKIVAKRYGPARAWNVAVQQVSVK